MTKGRDHDVRLIWATRGRTWGFRFLRAGGEEDPLRTYDRVFSELSDQPEAWGRVGDAVGLRFPDPDGRTDASGRIIPHELVVFGPDAGPISSLEDGRRLVWAEVADEFARVWDLPEPPTGSA
jgi:hypothetical protein